MKTIKKKSASKLTGRFIASVKNSQMLDHGFG